MNALGSEPIAILLVEDNPGDARLVTELLSEVSTPGFKVHHVEELSAAIAYIGVNSSENVPDVVLLDLLLPDSRGMQTLNQMLQEASHLPIIVLTGSDDDELALQALNSGAQDYLVKGRGDGELLSRAVRYAIERKRFDERLAFMAKYDALTGLANRAMHRERLSQALMRAGRDKGTVAVMNIDVDRFKSINDTMGHEVGDEFLQAVSERLRRCVRSTDTIARLAADEFSVVLDGVGGVEQVANVARKIFEVMERPFSLGERSVYVTMSVGIAMFPDCGIDETSLMTAADAAVTRAKEQSGSNNYQFYIPEMHAQALRRMTLENDLRHAVKNQEFLLYYQPQISLLSGEIIGAEALIRWQHPKMGLVGPNEFIPIAEEIGLIMPIGEWVLEEACSQAVAWEKKKLGPLQMWVNLSARQFLRADLAEVVERTLHRTGLSPDCLGLELTENLLLEDNILARQALEALNGLGLNLAIDDFGTGYSSLSYLTQYPIDCLKIDRSLLVDVCSKPDQAAIVSAIIELGHNLRMKVVAEGVEVENQARFLIERRCEAVQGFLYAKPMPAWDFGDWVAEWYSSPVGRALGELAQKVEKIG